MVVQPRNRAGKTHLGCLFTLFVLAAAVYVGIGFGEVYWRFYRLQDAAKAQAGYAPVLTDDIIMNRLVAYSDSLGVPLGRREWKIRRSYAPRQISITATYQDSVVIAVLSLRKVFRIDLRPSARSLY